MGGYRDRRQGKLRDTGTKIQEKYTGIGYFDRIPEKRQGMGTCYRDRESIQ